MSNSLLFTLTAIVALLMVACVSIVMILHYRKGAMRNLVLMNSTGTVEMTLVPEGAVIIGGELWRACSENCETIERGNRVCVRGVLGHLLVVAREL